MSALVSDTITTSAQITRGAAIKYSQNSIPYNYSLPSLSSSGQVKVTYAAGGGENGINKAINLTMQLGPSGTETVNFNTGALTGSITGTLSLPDGSTCSFAGINLLEFNLPAATPQSGSQSITVAQAGTNGFSGPFGASTVPFTITGSDSNGSGGSARLIDRSDSIGYPVSPTHCDLAITNPDGANTVTFTMTVGGQ
jgi:hypothetical protein